MSAQFSVCVGGRGYYLEWGKPATEMKSGDCVNIHAGIKQWQGAAHDSRFFRPVIEVPGESGSNE